MPGPTTPHQQLKASIAEHEGVRTHLYDDATGKTYEPNTTVYGHLTIGIGRNIEERGLSTDEINLLLENDIKLAVNDARKFVSNDVFERLSNTRQNVLTEMAFQMGLTRLNSFRKLKAALLRHDYFEAARQMMDSKWARNHKTRALKLTTRMRDGE